MASRSSCSTRDSAVLLLSRLLLAFDDDMWSRVPHHRYGLPFEVCPVHAVVWVQQEIPGVGRQWVCQVRDTLWTVHAPWQHMVPPLDVAPAWIHDRFNTFCVAGLGDDECGLYGPRLRKLDALQCWRRSMWTVYPMAQSGGSMGYNRDVQPEVPMINRAGYRHPKLLQHRAIAAKLWDHAELDLRITEGPLGYVPAAVTPQKVLTKINEVGIKNRLTSAFQSLAKGGSGANTAYPDFSRFHSIDDLVAAIVTVVDRDRLTPAMLAQSVIYFEKWDVSDCFHLFCTKWRDGDVCSFVHPVRDEIHRFRVMPFGPTNGPARAYDFAMGIVDARARGFGATPIGELDVPLRFGPDPPATLLVQVDDYVGAHHGEAAARESLYHSKGLVRQVGGETADIKDRIGPEVEYNGLTLRPCQDDIYLPALKESFYLESLRTLDAEIQSGYVVEGPFVTIGARLNWIAPVIRAGRAHIMPFFAVLYPGSRNSRAIDPLSRHFSGHRADPFTNPRESSSSWKQGRTLAIGYSPQGGRVWMKRRKLYISPSHPVRACVRWWIANLQACNSCRMFLCWSDPGRVSPRRLTQEQHAVIDASHERDAYGRTVTPFGYPCVTWDAATGDDAGNHAMGFGWFGTESFLIVFPSNTRIILELEYITGFYCRHIHPFEFFAPYQVDILDDRRLGLRGDNEPGLAARHAGYCAHGPTQQWLLEDWELEAFAPDHAATVEMWLSTHWNGRADAGSRGLLRPSTDDYHFVTAVYNDIVLPLAGANGYTVESHASVSGDNCRSPRWGHRFAPFSGFQFTRSDDVLINMPFTMIKSETETLAAHQAAVSFPFTYVLPAGAPSIRGCLHQLRALLRKMGASKVYEWPWPPPSTTAVPIIFMGRKTTYIFPDRSPGFVSVPQCWSVELWRKP